MKLQIGAAGQAAIRLPGAAHHRQQKHPIGRLGAGAVHAPTRSNKSSRSIASRASQVTKEAYGPAGHSNTVLRVGSKSNLAIADHVTNIHSTLRFTAAWDLEVDPCQRYDSKGQDGWRPIETLAAADQQMNWCVTDTGRTVVEGVACGPYFALASRVGIGCLCEVHGRAITGRPSGFQMGVFSSPTR